MIKYKSHTGMKPSPIHISPEGQSYGYCDIIYTDDVTQSLGLLTIWHGADLGNDYNPDNTARYVSACRFAYRIIKGLELLEAQEKEAAEAEATRKALTK